MPACLFVVASAMLCCAGAQRVHDSGDRSVEIVTFVGETVVLPCQMEIAKDEDVPSVEWSKEDRKPNISFLYRDGCESFLDKDPAFHYRTNLFMKELTEGNLSLRLSNVRLSDAGTHKCKTKVSPDTSTIKLVVYAVSEPKLSLVPGDGVTVQCEASCWFPLPEITLLDAQGDVIKAEDQRNDQSSSSGCFNVTRRATVQTSRVTCRVHLSGIKQTKVTEIYIPDDCMRSCFLPIIIAVVESIIIAISAISAFLWWKCCNSERGSKLHPAQLSHRSSTRRTAEGQNQINQADPVQNDTTEHRRKDDELKSNLRDKDETIRRLTKELNDLRSKQCSVECQHGQTTICSNPSKSSQDDSKPINFPPERFPIDTNPKPAASTNSNHPKSGNFSQNKDSKPNVSIQIPAPDPQIQRSSPNNSTPDPLTNSGDVSPTAFPASPSDGMHVGRSRSMTDSRSRINSAKVQRSYTISYPLSNRFSPLANLPENDLQPLLKMRTE